MFNDLLTLAWEDMVPALVVERVDQDVALGRGDQEGADAGGAEPPEVVGQPLW